MASDKSDPRFQQLVMSAIQSGDDWELQFNGEHQMEKLGVILRRFVSIKNVLKYDSKKKADHALAGAAALGKGAAEQTTRGKTAKDKKLKYSCLIC